MGGVVDPSSTSAGGLEGPGDGAEPGVVPDAPGVSDSGGGRGLLKPLLCRGTVGHPLPFGLFLFHELLLPC